MKIFIAGATGRVGTKLTCDLIEDGHEVIAGAHHPERVMQNDHVTPVKLGLHENVEEMRPALGDADAVYFTAGSGAKGFFNPSERDAIVLYRGFGGQGLAAG